MKAAYNFKLNQKAKVISLTFCVLFNIFFIQLACAQTVKIAVEKTFLNKYNAWLKEVGTCDKIKNFRQPNYARRGTLDLVFICQALKLGGWKGEVLFVEAPNYERALIMAREGVIDIPGESIWDSEINQNEFYQTEAIIKIGEFQLGFFVKPENLSKIKINSKDDIKRYTAVSSDNWKQDWKLWNKLMPKELYSTYSTESMFRMVNKGRADITLMGFSSASDKNNVVEGIKLVPVPGVKTTLPEIRRFVVSKKSLIGKDVFKALDKGIHILLREGIVQKAWRESGVINSSTDNWKMITP